MHLVGEITFGNVLTVLSVIVGAAFTGGKLVEVLKALAADVSEIKLGQEKADAIFRQHEKDDSRAFGEIHEKLIEIAMHRRASATDTRTRSSSIHTETQ